MNIDNLYLKNAVKQVKKMLGKVIFFSIITNMLMLVSPIFMLQLYDRVLTSGSYETLISLTVIALFLLTVFASVEYIRQRLMNNISIGFEQDIREEVFDSLIHSHVTSNTGSGMQSVQDVTQIRQFMSSPAIFAFFDAPWIPFFTGLIFIIHPLLGFTGLIGGIILFCMALLSEYLSRGALKESSRYNVESAKYLNATVRNARVLKSMNMVASQKQRWSKLYNPMLFHAAKGANRLGIISSFSKALRFVLQVLMLAVGGYLVLQQEITPGTMIASSIILGRALAPIEQAIGAWRGFVNARAAYDRIKMLMNKRVKDDNNSNSLTALPKPNGHWKISDVCASYGDSDDAPLVLKDINIDIPAGMNIGIIGPSGSGKTTLIQLMASITKPNGGVIRLDGIDVNSWSDLGKYMGYLPQTIELFEGTIAENITRFGDIDSQAMIDAAKMVGAHDVITKLPHHYNTVIKEGGINVSAGQRQLIGLTRTFYKQPSVIIMDEPSANIDSSSSAALIKALSERKKIQAASTIFVTHTIPMLAVVDKIIVIRDGEITDYGDKEDILAKFTARGRGQTAGQTTGQQQQQPQKQQSNDSSEDAKKENVSESQKADTTAVNTQSTTDLPQSASAVPNITPPQTMQPAQSSQMQYVPPPHHDGGMSQQTSAQLGTSIELTRKE